LVIDECVAVAASQGLAFEIDFMEEINEVFGPSRNIVSMLQDLRRGHPTEIDYMNGAVAALGAEHGLPCPVNQGLTDIIKAMEAQSRSLLPEEMLETQSPQARLGLLASRASG
jgi:2-dehydropantoate 2-reductase